MDHRSAFLVEAQRGGVDAVAQSLGAGAVGENVAEVSAAARAGDLGAHHAVAAVFVLLHMLLLQRNREAGPTAPGIKLGLGGEQLKPTGGAEIGAGRGGFGILPSEGALGALLTQNAVLLGSERTTPLFIRLANLFQRRSSSLSSQSLASQQVRVARFANCGTKVGRHSHHCDALSVSQWDLDAGMAKNASGCRATGRTPPAYARLSGALQF